MKDVVIVNFKAAEKIYTCPEVVYRYVKPLPVTGSTTTQRVDAGLLKDAGAALARLEDLTKDYGEDFHRELLYRYLNAPLIGDYYRRIWKLEDAAADELTKEADRMLSELDDERRERLAARNKDIISEDGRFFSAVELCQNPLVGVVITDNVMAGTVDALASGLYDQSEVSFCILADKKQREELGGFERMGNFAWIEDSSADTVRSALAAHHCKYAAIIDSNIIYNHGSLRALVRTLEDDPETEFASVRYSLFDGENIKESAVMKLSYQDDVPALDVFLANKLLRVGSEALNKALSSGQAGSLYEGSSYKRLETPVMLSLDANIDDLKYAGQAAAAELYDKILKSKEPTASQKVKRLIKRLLGRPAAKPSAGKDKKAAKKKKLSASADYYLNLDVDPELVVIEGLGKKPKGSSLYMLRELKKPEYSRFRICFVVKDDTGDITKDIFEREGLSDVQTIMAGSKEYKRALFTAGYLFNEVDFPNWWTKKPSQKYINIWHGTPLKTLTKKTEGIVHHDATSSRNFTMADYMLFANDYSIEHILMDSDCGKLTNTKGLMLGYPRTGELFDSDMRDKVRSECGISGKQVSVWMPTWNNSVTTEDVMAFLEDIDARLSDEQLLYVNMHHKSAVIVDYTDLKHIQPFPQQYDTYEVLAAADILITDYSSVFFDFAACGRKIILHCPDIDGYKASRGFNMDIRDLPFPITETNEDLIREMKCGKGYDDTQFMSEFNAYDSGRNTELLLRSMLLGDFSEVEIREFEKEPDAVFFVADSFREGRILDMLYELDRSGKWPQNVYLSFQEKVADEDVQNIYPLLRDVPIFATKGKPLTERTERNRLYNTIDIKRFVLADPADPARIRAFACFPEDVRLVLTERQIEEMKNGNKEMIKAVKRFNKYGNGIYTINTDDDLYLSDSFGITSGRMTDLTDVIL